MLLNARRAKQIQRGTDERGASAVESAIIMPLFLLFMFGIIEFGVFLFNANAVTNAARDAARESSTWAASPVADYRVLKAANRSLGSIAARTDAVVIYKAASPNSPVPAACLAAISTGSRGVATQCNIYRQADLRNLDETQFGWSALNTPAQNAGKWDTAWPATERNEVVTGLVEPDFVGVYIEANHKSLTGVVPSRKIRRTSVAQIEPQRAG